MIGLRHAGMRWVALFIAATLVGCASSTSLMPTSPAPGGVNLSGRISIKVEPGLTGLDASTQSLTARFELEGHPDDGLLSLSTPLGTLMAQARWVGDQAELTGPDGKRKHGRLDALTSEALGQHIPIGALMSWLQGHPAPDLPSTPLPEPDQGFDQLSWRVNLNRWADHLITATHEGADRIEVRVKLDATDASPTLGISPPPANP